jgi:hypothetical protein
MGKDRCDLAFDRCLCSSRLSLGVPGNDIHVAGVQGEPIRRSVVGAMLGWDNWDGLTVVVSSIKIVNHSDDHDQVLDALSRLSGVTTLVIWDGGAETEKRLETSEFKRKLREKAPHVNVRHVHLQISVG